MEIPHSIPTKPQNDWGWKWSCWKDHLVHLPAQGGLPRARSQGDAKMAFNYLKGQRCHHLSGQLLPVLSYPHRKCVSWCLIKSSSSSVWSLLLVLSLGTAEIKLFSTFFTHSLQVFAHIDVILCEPSVLPSGWAVPVLSAFPSMRDSPVLVALQSKILFNSAYNLLSHIRNIGGIIKYQTAAEESTRVLLCVVLCLGYVDTSD